MSFWEIVLAVFVGNLAWSLVTLPITIFAGVLLGVIKGLAQS